MRINFDSRAIEQQTDINNVTEHVICHLVATGLKQPGDGLIPYVPDSAVDSQTFLHLHPGQWITSSAGQTPAGVYSNLITKSSAIVLVMFPAPQQQFCIGHVKGLDDLQRMLLNVKTLLANGTNPQIVIMVAEGHEESNMFNGYAEVDSDGSDMNRLLNEYAAVIEGWLGDKVDKCTILGWIASWISFCTVLQSTDQNVPRGSIGHCKDINTVKVNHGDRDLGWGRDKDKDRDRDKDRKK